MTRLAPITRLAPLTTAETISARYGDDGQRWTDSQDILINDAAADAAQRSYDLSDSAEAHMFHDGSWLIIMHGGWDILNNEGIDGGGHAWLDEEGEIIRDS